MADAGPRRLPVLGRPGRGCSRPARGPANPARPGLLRPAGRRAARARHRARGSRSTTGTCRRRWRTPAAGRRGTPPTGSPTTPRSCTTRSATGCSTWTTLNEPWCSAFLGYALGRARARAGTSRRPRVRAAHHLLLGHGLAVAGAARRRPGRPGRRSRSTSTRSRRPPTAPADADAARRIDGLQNRFFLDPVLRGRVPGGPARRPGARSPTSASSRDGDLEMIAHAARRAGGQLLQPARGRRAGDGRGAERVPAGRRASWPGSEDVGFVTPGGRHRDGLGDRRRRAARVLRRVHRDYAAAAALRHRERRRLRRRR